MNELCARRSAHESRRWELRTPFRNGKGSLTTGVDRRVENRGGGQHLVALRTAAPAHLRGAVLIVRNAARASRTAADSGVLSQAIVVNALQVLPDSIVYLRPLLVRKGIARTKLDDAFAH